MNDKKKEQFKVEICGKVQEVEHFHQELELIYILEGKLTVEIENKPVNLSEEDILLINLNKKHFCRGSGEVIFVKVMIDYAFVSNILGKRNLVFWCDSTQDESSRYDELRKVLRKLLIQYLGCKNGKKNFEYIALCYHLTSLLTAYFLLHTSASEEGEEKNKHGARIEAITEFIYANYQRKITLKDLAEEFYLSEGYLSRFFKKNYGVNFAKYLENIRIYNVMNDLMYTNEPITDIAYNNGFSNITAFNKAFKQQHGMTPSAMRKKIRKQESEEKESEERLKLEKRLEQYLRTDGFKGEKIKDMPMVEKFSVGTLEKTKFAWNDMINIGTASDLLRSDVREHIILLQAALGFQYVRFWSLFSEDMLFNDVEAKEKGIYNFTKLDSVFDFLIQQGLKPHIELGNKPKKVHRTTESNIILGQSETEELPLEDMEKDIETMLRHWLYRYGKTEVETWRIELWFHEEKWNIPEAEQEYFTRFSRIYNIIRKYFSKLPFGGCGIRTLLFENEIQHFLEEWAKQPVKPDFLSVLVYSYEHGGIQGDNRGKRSTDPEYILHRITKTKNIIAKVGMEDCPLYITEWNMSISDRNYLNDSCFKGAWIIKNMIDCYGTADVMAYFSGTDRVAEYYDSGQVLHGGVGLLTKDGVLKPAGFAMDFLNRLYPFVVGRGKNVLVTTNGQDSYGILCHNQKSLGASYYFIREDEVKKESMWKYYEDREEVRQEIQISGVEDGIYKVKIYRVNESHGSVLDIWENMEFENELSRNDIKYLRRVCEPDLAIKKIHVMNGLMELKVDMKANEFMFIRVRKLPE